MTIGEKHTFRDFGLVPTSRPVINPPAPNLSFVEVPGADGALDISGAVSGGVTYANRTGSFEFYVVRGRDWTEVYGEIMAYLHGRRLPLVLEDAPSHFYVGRVSVSKWKSDKNSSFLTLDYNLEPFRYEVTEGTDVPWEVNCPADALGWRQDTFACSVSAPVTRTIRAGGAMPVVPVIWTEGITGSFTVSVNGKTYQLTDGKNRIPELAVRDSDVSLRFSGSAMAAIYTRRGWL